MRKIPIALGTAASLLAFGATAGAAQASATSHHHQYGAEFVSPDGAAGGADTSCATAAYSDINAAVAAAPWGGNVVVCPGTYDTQVVISKSLHLYGTHGAVINAVGQTPLTVGTHTLPGSDGIIVLKTSDVKVSGFKVTGASYDAILVAASSHVWVTRNITINNGSYSAKSGGSGVGVDLNSSTWSAATRNIVINNDGGGLEIADDLGPAGHNVVAWNYETRSYDGCGVIVAGHSTAGVTDNLIAHNSTSDNATAPNTGGSGLLLASEVPGETMTGNTFLDNRTWGNGLAGVTIHVHEANQDFNDTRVIGNWIGTNNLVGDPIGLFASPAPGAKDLSVPDLRTTGILAATASPVTGTVMARNHIYGNHYGIFLEALSTALPAKVHGLGTNTFRRVFKPVKAVIVQVPPTS
jgi:nitrous oxidase accessory protein NosD